MSEQTQTGDDIIYCPDVKVISDHRITLPAPQRDRIGIGHGDHVDMVIEHDGSMVDVPDVRVDSRYRVTIPNRTCERYGIEKGDYLNVTAAPVADE